MSSSSQIEQIIRGELPPLPGMKTRQELKQRTGLDNYRGYVNGFLKLPDSSAASKEPSNAR